MFWARGGHFQNAVHGNGNRTRPISKSAEAVEDEYMVTWKIALATGFAAVLVSMRAFAPDFGVLLGGTNALQQTVEAEAAKADRAAQTFGNGLSPADRRDLQRTCTALVANAGDLQAQRRLQELMARHGDNNPDAVLRFCLDPSYKQLQSELQASAEGLRRGRRGSNPEASVELQDNLQRQQRAFQAISNVMKTKHDTAKNSISNVR
jgi:hypothetical protein